MEKLNLVNIFKVRCSNTWVQLIENNRCILGKYSVYNRVPRELVLSIYSWRNKSEGWGRKASWITRSLSYYSLCTDLWKWEERNVAGEESTSTRDEPDSFLALSNSVVALAFNRPSVWSCNYKLDWRGRYIVSNLSAWKRDFRKELPLSSLWVPGKEMCRIV